MFIIKRCTAKISLNYINRCKTIVRMSSEGCIVAVCQLTSTNNKENNLKSVKRVVAEAANKCAKVSITTLENIFSPLHMSYLCSCTLDSIFTRSL